MRVDSKVVDYIASLARLYVDDEERELMSEQLGRILEHIDHLREVDVGDVSPTRHVVSLTNVNREDVPQPSLPLDESLANAPESTLDYFVVPKVLPD